MYMCLHIDLVLLFLIIKRYYFKLFYYDFMYVTFTEIKIPMIVLIFYNIVHAAYYKPGSIVLCSMPALVNDWLGKRSMKRE